MSWYCTKPSWARTTNWENLCAQKLRENLDINTETLKRRKEIQWLAHLRYKSYNLRKTYKLWCSLMRGKCYKNIPGAKRCNGKSTTDLKTKILFAVVENIWKLLCYYSMDDHSRFLFGWPLEEVETCPYLKNWTPLSSFIVTACQNIWFLDPYLECATCKVVRTLLRSRLVVLWPKFLKEIPTFGWSHFKVLGKTTSAYQEKASIRKK